LSQERETIAVDGKVLRGSYQLETDNNSESHPAIMLVALTGGARFDSGTPWVDAKTEITALPEFIKTLGLKGGVCL